jgi:flagellar basal body-associated protein FliL
VQAPKRESESEPNSDRSLYLILALVFCALIAVALGIALFVSMTSDKPDPAGQQVEAQQGGAQTPSLPSGVSSSVRPPSVSSPSMTAPSVSSSGISSGSVSAPSVTAPSVSSPSLSTPSVSGARLPSGQIPAATAQPAGQATESSGAPFLALIIVLSVLLVIAVGAAVYFAVRRA